MGERPVVYVVSDSVGETAELVVRAAASQFDGGNVEIRRFPLVSSAEAVANVVAEAAQQPSLIAFTIILPELRRHMQEAAARHGVEAVDIMGQMMDALGRVTGLTPRLQAGLLHKLDEEYFRRVEAVEFAVKYDDGKDARGCLAADVVLLGVSRSSKTPVSMYLAHRRTKVCNIPLVPESALPKEVFQIPASKVVGLWVSPDKLHQIRTERLKTIGLKADASYANPERIAQELEYAQEIYRRVGCAVVDVTNKAVEETAVRVLELIRKGAAQGDD